MVTGRELDALVAEKVMGFCDDAEQDEWPHWGVDEEGCMYARCPMYSEDIKDAWEVVEKLHALGRVVVIQTNADGWANVRSFLTDNGVVRKATEEGSYANTAPEAICLAALAAVGALPTPQGDG